jgi:hypothetical protein
MCACGRRRLGLVLAQPRPNDIVLFLGAIKVNPKPSEQPVNLLSIFAAPGSFNTLLDQQTVAAKQMAVDCRKLLDHSLERRQDATQALVECARASLSARSPQDVLSVWMHWSQNAIERLSEDVKLHWEVGASIGKIYAKPLRLTSTAPAPSPKCELASKVVAPASARKGSVVRVAAAVRGGLDVRKGTAAPRRQSKVKQ